jgi:hypothetical protein
LQARRRLSEAQGSSKGPTSSASDNVLMYGDKAVNLSPEFNATILGFLKGNPVGRKMLEFNQLTFNAA